MKGLNRAVVYSPYMFFGGMTKMCGSCNKTVTKTSTTKSGIMIIIIIIVFGSYWSTCHLQELSRHPGIVSQAAPGVSYPLCFSLQAASGVSHPLCFSLQIAAPGVLGAASLSLSLWVPGQGLACGAGHWLSDGVSNVHSIFSVC